MTSTKARQRRALAAGGTVLGIGAVLVAASWTDNVIGSSNFQAGRFGIESSVDGGTTWGSNPSSGTTNRLVFSPAVTSVVPGSTSYASIRLRTEIGSSASAVKLSGAQVSGDASLGAALVYRAVRLPAAGTACSIASFDSGASWVVGSAGAVALTQGSAENVFALPAATPTAAGAPVGVCFEIALPGTPTNWANAALQNKTTTPDWTFVGTS